MTEAFSISPERLAELAEQILMLAHNNGATHSQVTIDQSQGLSMHMRQDRVQSRVRETQSGFSLTVFNGTKQGAVHSTDLSPDAIKESVKAACAIARHTGEDPAVGPASWDQLCKTPEELDLYHPWDIDERKAVGIAQEIEDGIASAGPHVHSEGVWLNSIQSYFLLATSVGFHQGVAQSNHSFAASALARTSEYAELDFLGKTEHNAEDLPSARSFGKKLGQQTLAYLDQKPLSSRRCPVLFDPRSATSLIGHLLQAASGQALYTEASFLNGRLGQKIMAEHLSLIEDPFILGARASLSFDGDGIAPSKRTVVEDGSLNGYFLSLYTARRLDMKPTGNGFGPGNLFLKSSLTHPEDGFQAMLRMLGTGLLVTSLVGNGVRLISGDYSRGARGFWVENGQIQHAVTGITISDNLSNMLQSIVAVGNDLVSEGPFNSGSILIEQMQISG